MLDEWIQRETTSHQDHVIAHLLGATILGHFILDEAVHILLDMGFIWTIYVDGQMGFLPQSVLIADLDASLESKQQLEADCENLLNSKNDLLLHCVPAPVAFRIVEVNLFELHEKVRVIVTGEGEGLIIEMSTSSSEILLSAITTK